MISQKKSLMYIIILSAFTVSQGLAQVPISDSIAFYPHWELEKETNTTTHLYISCIGVRTDTIIIQFFKQNGAPFSGQRINLYVGRSTSGSVTTDGNGRLSFGLLTHESARLDMLLNEFSGDLAYGYAAITVKKTYDVEEPRYFVAWAETISTKKGWLARSKCKSSISVNGGAAFKLIPFYQ